MKDIARHYKVPAISLHFYLLQNQPVTSGQSVTSAWHDSCNLKYVTSHSGLHVPYEKEMHHGKEMG